MEIVHIPVWLIAVILMVLLYIGWKVIKFAIKIFLIMLIALIAIFLLDYLGIISLMKGFLTGI